MSLIEIRLWLDSLRGCGNAINPIQAAEFVGAFMEASQ